jgi:AcrR family transcriptional regulator
MADWAQVGRGEKSGEETRAALIEAAARLIATEGVGALTLRRVADEVGTSTMAIYTHFGGMPELRHAVRREGFSRLADYLAQVGRSDDPVADLALIGRAYYENGIRNAHLYRVMFMEQPLDAADAEIGLDTFETVIAGIQRCIDAGRFTPADATERAVQFWVTGHGIVSLQLANLLTTEQALQCMGRSALTLFGSYGDVPDAAYQSLIRARDHPGVSPPSLAARRGDAREGEPAGR